jgi:hypothetical protein
VLNFFPKASQALLAACIGNHYRLYRQSVLDVWQAYFDLNTAATGIDVSSSVLRSANRLAEGALARYKSGVGSLLDLLTAQADRQPRGCRGSSPSSTGTRGSPDWRTRAARSRLTSRHEENALHHRALRPCRCGRLSLDRRQGEGRRRGPKRCPRSVRGRTALTFSWSRRQERGCSRSRFRARSRTLR